MKKIAEHFGGLPLRTKLALSTSAAALIPLLLLSLILGYFFLYNIRDKSSQLTLQVVNQTSESMDIYISTIEKLMNYVVDEGGGIDRDNEEETEHMEELTSGIMKAYPEIAGITLAYSDDSYLSAGMSRISRDLFADESWFRYAVEKNGELGVIGNAVGRNVVGNLNDSSDSIFSLVKAFDNGVVLFDIRHDMIKQLINRASVGESGFLYVVDENDVVYTPSSPIVYRIDSASYSTEGRETDTIRIDGSDYFIANHCSSYSGWRVVGVIPKSDFYSSISGIYKIMLISVFMSIVLAVFVSMWMSATVTKPILKLSRLMERVEDGDFSVRFKPKYRDEVGVLGSSFNNMLEKMDELINELYREKQIRLEAQLKSLQEQVKPHFLYNTLDTISWMARAQGGWKDR